MSGKKGNRVLIVIIVILSLLLVGSGGYIYYLSVQKVKETNNNSIDKSSKNDSSKVIECDEVIDVTSDEVMEILQIFNFANNSSNDTDIYFTDKKFTLSDVDQSLAGIIALNQMYIPNNNKNNNIDKGYAFTSDELHENIEKSFGKDYKYEDKSIDTVCTRYNYDPATKRYTISSNLPCGGEAGPGNIKKVAKVIKNSKKLEIYVRVLFIGGTDYDYFYDYARTKNTSYNPENIEGYKDYIINDASLYKITFTNDGSNYIFTSSEPVND